MKNDLITIAVERMSNGMKLRSSTTLPMSMFDYTVAIPGSVVWGEIVFLQANLDEKEEEISAKLNDKP